MQKCYSCHNVGGGCPVALRNVQLGATVEHTVCAVGQKSSPGRWHFLNNRKRFLMNPFEQFIVFINTHLGNFIHAGSSASSKAGLALGLF